jgi:hypothetical protein
VAKFITGLDASGDHAVYNTASTLAEGVDTTHIIVVGFSLISIKVDETDGFVVYHDKHPICSESERPLGLIPGKETRETYRKLLKTLDDAREPIYKEPMLITCGDFMAKVQAEISLTQLDGKMLTIASGLGGAYCTACTVSQKDAHRLERIKQGFEINRTIESSWQLFMELADECGNVSIAQGDYQRCLGLTQRPLTTSEILANFPVMHSYIRALNWYEIVVYRINANVQKMGLGTRFHAGEKKRIEEAKKLFQHGARNGPMKMRLIALIHMVLVAQPIQQKRRDGSSRQKIDIILLILSKALLKREMPC